jgi:predicted dehydrogenase
MGGYNTSDSTDSLRYKGCMVDRRRFIRGAGAATAVAASAPYLRSQEPASSPIRIGQFGTKHAHASGKMAAMRKFPKHFEVVGVVEPDDAQWERVKDRYAGVPRLTEEQLLNVDGLKAVDVETAVRNLVPTGIRCVEAGMHIHLDKPGGSSMADCRKLHAVAQAKKRTVQMGYMLRYNPAFQLCYRAVREGWLGDLFELHAVMSKTSGESARREMAEFSGGAMFELGCHLIDSVVYVLGTPDKVTPYLRKTKEGDDLADNTMAVLEYPKATATIRSALVEFDGFKRRQFVVCGTEGTVDIKPLESPVMQLGLASAKSEYKRGYQTVELPESTGRYDAEFIDLAKIIREEKEPDFSHAHDLAVHEVILRASGMPV